MRRSTHLYPTPKSPLFSPKIKLKHNRSSLKSPQSPARITKTALPSLNFEDYSPISELVAHKNHAFFVKKSDIIS